MDCVSLRTHETVVYASQNCNDQIWVEQVRVGPCILFIQVQISTELLVGVTLCHGEIEHKG